MLLEPEHKKKALDVIHAGKEYVEHTMSQKRKQLKKDWKPTVVEEDDLEVETRDGRMDSWRNFQSKGKTKKEKNRTFLKPPRVKMEQRETMKSLNHHPL